MRFCIAEPTHLCKRRSVALRYNCRRSICSRQQETPMNNALLASIVAITALIVVHNAADAQTSLSSLTAATGSNTIDNGNNPQTWNWSTLTNNQALTLQSNGTSATNGQQLLNVYIAGTAAANNAQTTAGRFANAHSGTGSANIAVSGEAIDGDKNWAIYGFINSTNAGDAGVWGDSRNNGGGATYGVYGTNASPAGYAGYFSNSGGGYAAAFVGGNVGIGTATPLALLHESGGVTAGAWGASGIAYRNDAATFTDNSTSAGSTVTNAMVNAIGQPTITASNGTSGNKVTYTNAATVYIANAPTAGTNTIITNPYALDIATGASYFGGHLTVEGVTSTGATGTGNFMFSASPTTTGTLTGAAANFSGNVCVGCSGYSDLFSVDSGSNTTVAQFQSTGTQALIELTDGYGGGYNQYFGAYNGGFIIYADNNVVLYGDSSGRPYLENAASGALASYYACFDPSSSPSGEISYQASNCTSSTPGTKEITGEYSPAIALHQALQLRPITFIMKKDPELGEMVGLSAPEVERVNKDLAGYNPKTGKLITVQYDRIGVVAIAALQEQQKEIDDLTAQLIALGGKPVIRDNGFETSFLKLAGELIARNRCRSFFRVQSRRSKTIPIASNELHFEAYTLL